MEAMENLCSFPFLYHHAVSSKRSKKSTDKRGRMPVDYWPKGLAHVHSVRFRDNSAQYFFH